MFEMIYALSTFGISSKGIFKTFVATRSREREAAKVFCFSLHDHIIEALKRLYKLKKLGRTAKLSMAPWIGSGQCLMRPFFLGDFLPVSTTNFIKRAHWA